MKWYSIRRPLALAVAAAAVAAGTAAPKATSAEVWIYGDIGESWWGETVTAKEFVQEIAALEVEQLSVRINSQGGSVPDGLSIYNALKRHPATVAVSIDGVAASIASLIAMAGDTVEIADNARIMVHAPWAVLAGNAVELRNAADLLDGWAHSMAGNYAAKTGQTADAVLAWLTDGKDHWFSAEEAVAQGLADTMVTGLAVAASASKWPWASAPDAPARTATAAAPQASAAPVSTAAAQAATTTEPFMPQPNAAANTQQAANNIDEATRLQVQREENQRQADIRAAFRPHIEAKLPGAQKLLEDCLADVKVTKAEAGLKLLDVVAKTMEPAAGGYIVKVEDERDKMRTGMRSAIEIRAGLAKNEGANPWRAATLMEMAKECLVRAGVRPGDFPTDKRELTALAFTHGTSDFPNILANVANKAMLKGYDEVPETFPQWTNKGSLPDFKQGRSVDLGSMASLRTVTPGAEYKFVTFGERAEVYALLTYGEMFGIDRQTIINDDVGAFTRIPQKMGRAAKRTVGDLAYAQLTGNPTMGDGIALFHASHNNLQGAAAITTTSVDAMRTAMGTQKDIGQTSGALNLDLAILLVPKALDGAANTVRKSQYEITSGARNNTTANSQQDRFIVISDARLDAASTSQWYGLVDPMLNDTVTLFYLDGNEAPFMDQQQGWNRDGVQMKVRIDVAAKALDWRGMQRNG